MSFTAILSSPQARLGRIRLAGVAAEAESWQQSEAATFSVLQQFVDQHVATHRLHAGFVGARKHVDFEVPAWGEFAASPVAL